LTLTIRKTQDRGVSVSDHIDTIIIGGGQCGLSISYYLKDYGREHVIFEKAHEPASAWRNRWDSFTLVTPNWMVNLPGAEYDGEHPEAFMDRAQVITYFESYIQRFSPPVKYGVTVLSVEPCDAGYRVLTDQGDFTCANVVIAVGFYQQPKLPPFSENVSANIHQIHSDHYKNPQALPQGAVLVVGSAQSGSQIAEELNESGRQVYLSVSTTGRFPRRYRGIDAAEWMKKLGYFERTVDQLSPNEARFASSAHGTGKNGGHTINLHQFAKDGITLLGRISKVSQDQVFLASDLKDNLAKADQFELEFVKSIDDFIEENGLDLPPETLPNLQDGFNVQEIHELELQAAGIRNIVWATGYAWDYSWVKLPILDKDGLPQHTRGVTPSSGLYVIGMPFLHSGKSGLIYGAAEDAAYIASNIVGTEVTQPFYNVDADVSQ
jgi:putative flavoprotein involved in K+ transport